MTFPEDTQPQQSLSDTQPNHLTARARRRQARRKLLSIAHDERSQALEQVARKAFPTIWFFALSLLSGGVIGLGYIIDAQAVVLAGLLLAPLMNPWIGMALATTTGSLRYFSQALGSFLIGAGLVFMTTMLAGFAARIWMPLTFNLAFFHSRIWWHDLLVIALAAPALIYAFVRTESRPVLPSVVLAYAFYLPVASAGFGFGVGLEGMFPDGLLVFAIYYAWAMLFGVLTLFVLKFRPHSFAGYTLSTTITLVMLIAIVGLSGLWTMFTARMPVALPDTTATVGVPAVVTQSLPDLPDTPTPIPSQTATKTPFPATATATSTITPQPTPVYAIVQSQGGGGAIVRPKPGALGHTAIVANGELLEILPETQLLDGATWVRVYVIRGDEKIEGWILQNLVATATPGTP